MTTTTQARVPTASASRYLQQLCRHWSHNLNVTFDASHGEIRFPSDAVCTLDAETDALLVTVSVPDVSTMGQVQEVVARHLDRFAFREAPLPFDWQPVA